MTHTTRILMVTFWFPPSIGGVSRQAMLLSKSLVSKGHLISIATTRGKNDTKSEDIEKLKIHRLWSITGGYRTQLYSWLFSLLIFLFKHNKKYDIIHVHQALYPAALCVTVAKILGKKSVVKVSGSGSSGNMEILRTRWFGWIARHLISRADRLICLSDEMNSELLINGMDQSIISKIPNGVDLSIVSSPNYLADKKNFVLNTGRLSHEKGIDILVKAWPQFSKIFPSAKLVILGDGLDRSRLESIAQEGNSTESIIFAGDVRDVKEYYETCAVFVLPSRHEGLSNSLLEAMAAGCACIVSDISPNRELIQDGINGLVFRSGDSNDLASKLISLFSNDSLQVKIGQAAIETIRAKFMISSIADKYIELYMDLTEDLPFN